jgi:peptidoglycan/LPS O-acetylase OafA/YrhL
MVAVLLVVLSHLLDWPRGGFIGVDVFFVISGFLITGSLLHTQEKQGRISFSNFYRRRIRRIVPAATLVLFATVVASYLVLNAARAKSTLLDAAAGFLFFANWRFAVEGTDYFNAGSGVSPLQHYWSLSVEEQFYFVWPAVVLVIGLVAGARSRRHRLALSAAVMGTVVVGSFVYSVLNTEADPTWAYFSTFARVWELGVGAMLAITISYFDRIPSALRPVLAWIGLIAIVVGAFIITEDGGGFPAPWAAVPVLGAALVIGAGVRGSHTGLSVLTNRVSTYIGDISYSLYLWHWPVIILLTASMKTDVYMKVAATGLMFSSAVLSYHYFEDPIRKSRWLATSSERAEDGVLRSSRWRLPAMKRMSRENQVVGAGAGVLFTVGLAAIALVPPTVSIPPTLGAAVSASGNATAVGPLQIALTAQISAAIQAPDWPELSPSMDAAIAGPQAPNDVTACGKVDRPDPGQCTWGNPNAPRMIMVLGDSVAMTYVQPLRAFAEASDGQWKVRSEAMFGCTFVDLPIVNQDAAISAECPARKTQAVAAVNEFKPDTVVITNTYEPRRNNETGQTVTPNEWRDGMKRMVDQFTGAGKVVFLAPPPSDVNISECFNRVNKPADCISRVTPQWLNIAAVEQGLGTFADPRPWFCVEGYCPSFVGSTPTKLDKVHMTPQYATLISPVVVEAMRSDGILD